MRWATILAALGLSLVVHVGMGYGAYRMPKPTMKKSYMVKVGSHKKKAEEKKEDPAKDEPPPPPPKPVETPRHAPPKPKAAPENTPPPKAAPNPVAAAHPALAALPDLGISMGGGSGPGIAVPVGPVGDGPGAGPATTGDAPKALAPKEDCTEALVKPKPLGGIQQGTYTEQARAAGVEGRVKIEVQIDASGAVTGGRIISGVGYGLDESALAAAKRSKYTSGTRCGKPVAATLIIAMRFALE
jgi:protein TonB